MSFKPSIGLAFWIALIVSSLACGPTPEEVPPGMQAVVLPSAADKLTVAVPTRARTPWNIIVISVDTLRADHLGIYGYGRETSPQVDLFGRSAVVFEQAFSQSPKTATSHMTMFTGVYPESHGVVNWTDEANTSLSPDLPTLATLLKGAGYRTEAYTGGGNVRAELGFDLGFDVYEKAGRRAFDRGAEALERFASAEAEGDDRSFLLFIHTYQVHDPYLPPPRYRDLFVDPEYAGGIVDSFDELSDEDGWWNKHNAFWESANLDDPEDVRHLVNLYDAGIRVADDQFSGMLEVVRRLGLLDSTIIVFTSDHGEEFTEHGSVLHDSVYQEVLQVPFLLHLPPGAGLEAEAGKRITNPIRLVDLTPTLLDLLGLPEIEHMMGRSIVPLLSGPEGLSRPVFAEYVERKLTSLAAGDWKLILSAGRERGRELYDLRSDPGETQDLSASDAAKASYLRTKLLELRKESAKLARLAGEGSAVELDDDARRELEALGYLGGKN